jgi:hypothetical protein
MGNGGSNRSALGDAVLCIQLPIYQSLNFESRKYRFMPYFCYITTYYQMDQSILSRFSKNLFWDADLDQLDVEKNAPYIVNRVLDRGRWEDWLFIRDELYGLEKIKDIALDLRSLLPQSLAFIATVTRTPENQFRCYKQTRSKSPHWIY